MKSDQMLEEFRLWCKATAGRLKGEPLFAKIRRSEVEDETLTSPLYKAGFDFETGEILAAFTVWGNGDLQVIIMSQKTGEHLVVDDRHLETPAEMHPVLDHYANLIVDGGPFTEEAP